VLLLLASVAAGRAGAADLAGRVQLLADGKPVSSGEVREAVVSYEPRPSVPVQPTPQPLEIVMREKEFLPHVLAVTRGSTVRFPNADPILHNVFSVSPENPFDLGLYGNGPGKTCTFAAAGLVRVYCNVHHSMVAYVLVLDTPFFASPAPDGTFRLTGLPEGEGTLRVWQERCDPWSVEVRVPAAGLVDVRIEITHRRLPPHLDKFGKPYRETRSDRSYR
jgi:plastocyanin